MSSYVTHMMTPTMMTTTAMINTKKTTPTPAATPPTLLALVGSGATGTRWGNRYSNVTIVIVVIVIVTIVIVTIVTITTVSGSMQVGEGGGDKKLVYLEGGVGSSLTCYNNTL